MTPSHCYPMHTVHAKKTKQRIYLHLQFTHCVNYYIKYYALAKEPSDTESQSVESTLP